MTTQKGHLDWYVLLGAAGLMLMGCVFVYSASVGFAMNSEISTGSVFATHTLKVLLGLITMIVVSQINYHFWQKISKWLMFIAAGLLIIVLIPKLGHTSHGASRWISLGIFSFQPSEIAKIAIVIHFSTLLVKNKENIQDFQLGFVPFLIWIGGFSLLIAMQPNFSTMMVLFAISMIHLFIGNVRMKHLALTASIGAVAGLIYGLSESYRLHRILAYLGFEDGVNLNVNHQIDQSLIAIGNGGLMGVGIGQSRQSHRFLPEAHSDFIFSIIGEEYGFIGLFIMLAIFAFIIYRGFRIAKNAPDDYGYFLGSGIIVIFSLYVLINAGVCLGLLPTTGLPLPFISYGGTAILINAATIGILLNISVQANILPRKKKSAGTSTKQPTSEENPLEHLGVTLIIDKDKEAKEEQESQESKEKNDTES